VYLGERLPGSQQNSLNEANVKRERLTQIVLVIVGSDKRRFFAVLQLGAIRSPVDAVRAAIVAEARRNQ